MHSASRIRHCGTRHSGRSQLQRSRQVPIVSVRLRNFAAPVSVYIAVPTTTDGLVVEMLCAEVQARRRHFGMTTLSNHPGIEWDDKSSAPLPTRLPSHLQCWLLPFIRRVFGRLLRFLGPVRRAMLS